MKYHMNLIEIARIDNGSIVLYGIYMLIHVLDNRTLVILICDIVTSINTK